MQWSSHKKLLLLPAAFLGGWLAARYLLPVLLPFLLGAALALAAEPLVLAAGKYLKLSRRASAGIGVTVTLAMLLGLVSLAGAAAVRELGRIALAVPDLERTAGQGMALLRDWLEKAAAQAPEAVRPVMTRSVRNLFEDGTELMEQVTRKIPSAVSSALSWVPSGLLGVGTGILSAFMVSARLPQLKALGQAEPLRRLREKYLPTVRRIRSSLWAWFRAQLKLMLVSYGIAGVGFLLLGIRRAPLLAALVALVDAVPMLGTGLILLPWALVSYLQQRHLRAFGLLGIYLAAAVTRAVLEPRLVGKHLGLDPLLTLAALYAGYRLWGLPGMLLAPVLASAVKTALLPGDRSGGTL